MSYPNDPNGPSNPGEYGPSGPYGNDPFRKSAPQYGQPAYGQPAYGQPAYGQPGNGGYGPPGPQPDNNLVWGILATVLCCLPLGIVSIVKATQVNTLWAQGDYAGAQKSADEAKKWAIWSAGVGAAVIVLIVLFYLILGVAIVSSDPSTTY